MENNMEVNLVNVVDSHTIEESLTNSINNREMMTIENLKKAEQIGFKNAPDKVIKTDQFGFIKEEKNDKNNNKRIEDTKESRQKILRENARLEKWNIMLSDFDNYYKKNFEKLKSRTRKGIPDSIRGLIWQYYSQISTFMNKETEGFYERLVNEETTDLETESVILRDIDRTFPKHTFFKDKYGLG
jgi:hypothetical protein